MRKNGKFEIYKDTKDEIRFRLKSANGEIIATSESYKTKQGAKNAIEAIREITPTSEVVDVTEEEIKD